MYKTVNTGQPSPVTNPAVLPPPPTVNATPEPTPAPPSAPRRQPSGSTMERVRAMGFGVKSSTHGTAVVLAASKTSTPTYSGPDLVAEPHPVPAPGEGILSPPKPHRALGKLGAIMDRQIDASTSLTQSAPALPAGLDEQDVDAARTGLAELAAALDGKQAGAFNAIVQRHFAAATAEQRGALCDQLQQLEQDSGDPAAVVRLAHTLSLTCSGAAQASAVLDYFRNADLPAQIGDAAAGRAIPAGSAGAEPRELRDTRVAAWHTAQALAVTPEARTALRTALGRCNDKRYRFHEPVLTVFLKTANRLLENRQCAGPLPEQLFGKSGIPKLPQDGLRAAAKRMQYDGPLKTDHVCPDGQPDLTLLTPLERYHYAMARNGIDDDGPGSAFARYENRIEKICSRSVQTDPEGKSPASAITLQALLTASRGESAKCKAAQSLLVELARIEAGRNSTLAPLTAASTPAARADRVAAYRHEAVLTAWSKVRFLEVLKGQAFSGAEVRELSEQVLARLDADGVPYDRAAVKTRLEKELGQQRISAQLLEKLFADRIADETAAASLPAAEADALREQHRLLRVMTGRNTIDAQWWTPSQSTEQRLASMGAVIKESICNMAIGAYVEGRQAKLNGANTRGYISTALSLAAGVVGLNLTLRLGAAMAKQSELKFGLSGNSGYLSFLSKKAVSADVTAGVLAGAKIPEEFGGVMAGAGVDVGYVYDDAHAEGLSFRMARMGREARGNYPGRAVRGAGDAQLLQELGTVGQTLFVGPGEADRKQGLSTRTRKVLAEFPDGVSLTMLAPREDSKTAHTWSTGIKGGASLGLFAHGGFGATVSGVASLKLSKEAREERGSALSVSTKLRGASGSATVAWGVGANAAERLSAAASQNLGSVDLYGGSVRLWDDGKTEKTALILTEDSIAKNSNRLTTYTAFESFLKAIAPDRDTVAADIAKGNLSRSFALPKGQPVSPADQAEALEAAYNAISQYLIEAQRDLRPTQTFQKFDELTDESCAKLNQLHTTAQLAGHGRHGDPRALAHATEEARVAVMNDAKTWMLGFYMTLDTDDAVRQQGMDYVLRLLDQQGLTSNYLVKWLSGS